MKYQYLKISQIIILSLIAIYEQNFLIYIGTLILALFTHQRHWLSSIIGVGLIAITLFSSFQVWKFVLIVFMGILALLGSKLTKNQNLNIKYVIPVFLLSISMISINQNQLIRIFHLTIFFYFLLLTYYAPQAKLKLSLHVLNFISVVEGSFFSIQHFLLLKQLKQSGSILSQNRQWWYYLAFPFSIQCACLIIQALKRVHNLDQEKMDGYNQARRHDQIQIQLTDMKPGKLENQSALSQISKGSQKMQDLFKDIQVDTGKQTKLNTIQKGFLQKAQIQSQADIKAQDTSQSESLNLILIIPFLAQHTGLLQIPLYVYIFSIHYNKTTPYLYLVMLLTNFAIIYISQEKEEQPLEKAILLRFCVVLLVNKNIHILTQATQIVKKIWLRSSFVVVLGFLFWFSLMKVNILHIVLTIVLLIFITKQNEKNEYSYRHKKWIYLLSFFNLFLLARQVYQLLIYYGFYTETLQNSTLQNIIDLTGISHRYQSQPSYFNLIPLIVSVFLAFQYLTYESRIYNQVRKRPILPVYEQKINQLIKLFTIVYYKLIPWVSYLLIFFVLLSLEFSCTSLILLVWLLVCLAFQVHRKNSPRTYEIMYRLWGVLERLFAVQILLRYAFEFLNFPMFYMFFHRLPFFETIDHYKQFLGLAIKQADYVYFKAITKFQLMVGLDFACIFITFLVIQYYSYLIAYHEIQNPTISRILFRHKEKINQIYTQFIDFKLTILLKKFTVILKRVSKVFLWLYYPILGIYCCLYPSIITFAFLLVCISFYLSKNSGSYDKFIRLNLIAKVKDLFDTWKQQSSGNALYTSARNIYDAMISGKRAIRFEQLVKFESLRKFIIVLGSLGIVLNYTSRIFKAQQTGELFGSENSYTLLKTRWVMYVLGASIDSQIQLIQLLIILGSTILQVKCTRFLLKLYDLSAYRNHQIAQDKINKDKGTQDDLFRSVQRSLYVSLLDKDVQNQKQLKKQLEQFQSLHDADDNPALYKNIEKLREQDGEEQFARKRQASQLMRRKDSLIPPSQIGEGEGFQLKVTKKQLSKFIQMKVSLLQGCTKFTERCFVMVLVFLSIVQNRHPFCIVYLVCSMALTFLGAYSILNLSRIIAVLIALEYILVLANYANFNITESGVPAFKENFQSQNTFDFIYQDVPKEWELYLTFGDTKSQLIMMILSWVILFSYQLYFYVLSKSWQKILESLAKKMALSKIEKRIYEYSNVIYTYFLIYSPLCITVWSLGIYLLDFTITNLFLTCVSILFLFKSVLVEQYSGSRQFWRLYFYTLQFFIVIFMLIYDFLSIPMYQKYCIKILCSPEEFHTKVYKAGLLFVLQIGIDLTKSSYFISALDNLKMTINEQAFFSKLALAYKQNDRKINKKFKQMNQENSLEDNLFQVQQFLQKYKSQPDAIYENKQQISTNQGSWMDVLIETLPSFIDSTLVLTSKQAKQFVSLENKFWIYHTQLQEAQLHLISQKYLDEFGQIQDQKQLLRKIKSIKQQIQAQQQDQSKLMQKNHSQQQLLNSRVSFMMRKSFSQNRLLYEPQEYCRQRLEEMRQSLNNAEHSQLEKKQIQSQEKKKLVFLLSLQSIISNWHYLTYLFLILQHLINMGLLTLPFPLFCFCYGLIHSYQAPKNMWRILFLTILLPISFKFSLAIGLLDQLSDEWVHLLIGDHPTTIWLQYLVIMFVLIQCLILKIIGLYDQTVTQVQSMKLALIRNIINCEDQKQAEQLQRLLRNSLFIPQSTAQSIFGTCEQKAGYSYTTLMTSLQLTSLFFVFLFYDQMAIRKQATVYTMISYNQFTAGMVILTLVQLGFILVERFINITSLKQLSSRYELNLVFKYITLGINLLYTELLVLVFFPLNSNNYQQNYYIYLFYVINAFTFLVSSLQIKYGVDQKSKGFMDRYTWYNGFVYMGFRAVPFLFQFKVFSDWTFTKTALRLFDWIKLEEIFGRMYIAKCNSIFLRGKVIGSKIQWWKKLLMGFPLLFAIILLIFGPLILFSNLNPLASKNSISAGYLELCLKVNKTNQYVFYTNSHITDIIMLTPSQQQRELLSSYDIEQDTVQVINLEEYSDQYWQISQGSYLKLLQESQQAHYQIVIRMKFQRNQTGSTPIYTVNSYVIPSPDIENFKATLRGENRMALPGFLNGFLRLDNNNGIHALGDEKLTVNFYVQQAKKSSSKKYWILENGLKIKIASDKYTKAIFGYSVMSFYISIILVIANYFRFLFQGSANTIILNDIPFADPVLSLCNGVYKARYYGDTQMEERLFWIIIDLLRSPDEIKSLTGSYLQARIQTKKIQEERMRQIQQQQHCQTQMQEVPTKPLQKKNN